MKNLLYYDVNLQKLYIKLVTVFPHIFYGLTVMLVYLADFMIKRKKLIMFFNIIYVIYLTFKKHVVFVITGFRHY
jgi:apolipoprotein N-acyltransferase